MAEIDRCVARSAGMAFLFLSGERYGWRPLPKIVPKEELEALVALLPPEDAAGRDTVALWYRLDSNALPPVYSLRRISECEADAEGAAAYPAAVRHFWDDGARGPGAQSVIQASLRPAAAAAGLAGAERDKWELSVTHHEVQRALDASRNPRLAQNCLCVVRDIAGLQAAVDGGGAAAKAARDYHGGAAEDVALLQTMRRKAEASIGEFGSVLKYEAAWAEGGISLSHQGEYVRKLCADVYARIETDVTRSFEAYAKVR